MIKLMEICSMFMEFLKENMEFTTIEFRTRCVDHSERDMLELYRPLKENGGYMDEIKTVYYPTFSSETELDKKQSMYFIYIWSLRADNIDQNEELKKKVMSVLEELKKKGFQLKCYRYFCDCYYGVLEKD